MPSSSAFSSDTRAKRARLDDASMMMQEEDVVLVVVPHPSPVGFVDPESPEVQEELAKANNMTWEQYQALYAKFAPTKQQYEDATRVIDASKLITDPSAKLLVDGKPTNIIVTGVDTMDKLLAILLHVLAANNEATRKNIPFSVVIVEPNTKAKAPHPKTLLELETGKLQLNGALLVTPEFPTGMQPLYIAQKLNQKSPVCLCFNGGVLGNMQPLFAAQVSLADLGVKSSTTGLVFDPKTAIITSKEQLVQFPKVLATLYPALRAQEGVTEADCHALFERLMQKPDLTCKEAKGCGRKAKLQKAYFALCPDLALKAGVAAQLLHLSQDGDEGNDARMLFNFLNNMGMEACEAAMQQGSKTFSGWDHDTIWGSAPTGVQACMHPFTPTLTDKPKIEKGIFARVIDHVQGILEMESGDDIGDCEDDHALAFLGLDKPISVDDRDGLRAAAGCVLNGIVRHIEKVAQQQAAICFEK